MILSYEYKSVGELGVRGEHEAHVYETNYRVTLIGSVICNHKQHVNGGFKDQT